jgi:hypothetical protein
MRLRYAAVLLLASVCAGQQVCDVKHMENCAAGGVCGKDMQYIATDGGYACVSKSVISQPKPLKCGKYEHIETEQSFGSFGHSVCAPIMHEVTEKEWQELMQRIDALREWNLSIVKRLAAAGAGKE